MFIKYKINVFLSLHKRFTLFKLFLTVKITDTLYIIYCFNLTSTPHHTTFLVHFIRYYAESSYKEIKAYYFK